MSEYAFDVDLRAVVRVEAETEEEARELLDMVESISGPEDLPGGVRLTEYSIYTHRPNLFEVDGTPIPEEEQDGE